MLTPSAYWGWFGRLHLDASAKQVIDAIRSSQPSRRVLSGSGDRNNVSARFPSIKMQVILQAESRTIELAYLRQADHDLNILEIWDQPPTIDLHYLTRGGRPQVAAHTPDFFVLWQDRAGWIECKPIEKLIELAQKQPNRYLQNEAGEWICPPGIAYAKPFGLTYTVVTEEHLDSILVGNFAYLDDYYRHLDAAPDIAPETMAQLHAAVTERPGLSKTDLAHLEPPIAMDTLHWLIVRGEIYVDLRACPLTDGDYVHVYQDSDQAQIYELCAPMARSAWFTGAEPLQYEPGTPLIWDGKPWLITNVGETHIYLQLQDGSNETNVAMTRPKLRDLYLGGHISTVRVEHAAASGEPSDKASAHNAHYQLLSGATLTEQRRALTRFHRLQRYWAGDLTVLDEVGGSERSLYRFQERWRAAEAGGSPGLAGLIDHLRRSGRGPQISDAARALLETSVNDDYSVKQQPNIGSAYKSYLGRCTTAGMNPVSFETYRLTVHAQPLTEQIRGRRGRRAAYAHSPFTALAHGNRHGGCPFQRVHADHTQLDIEVVSPLGERLGRPWLTLWFDAYSRRVLAYYLTFDPPSYRSNMMAARECVRRHGRLPMTLILDNGTDFGSTYFETLMASYGVTIESRPKAKARFGSVIERMFGTMNSQFFHNLLGNTQIMRKVREVTKSVDPKAQAVWTLPALHDAFSEWCYEVYDQTPHSGLHKRTPRAVFLDGQAKAGARDHSPIRYDAEFLRLTSPSTPKGTVQVSPQRTVKVNYILYGIPASAGDVSRNAAASNAANVTSDPADDTGERDDTDHSGDSDDSDDSGDASAAPAPGSSGSRPKQRQRITLPVRYDPENLGHIWVMVNGAPVECFANNYDIFLNRTEREVALASEEIRALDRQAGRTPAVSHSRLVEFFGHIHAHEAVLLQHLRDEEVRRAKTGNSANLGWLSEPANAPSPAAPMVTAADDNGTAAHAQDTSLPPGVVSFPDSARSDSAGAVRKKAPFMFDDSDSSELF